MEAPDGKLSVPKLKYDITGRLYMRQSDILSLSIPADLTYLTIAHNFVRETSRKRGFSGDDLYKIELALEEAITNVIQHAFTEDEKESFHIFCKYVPLGIEIIIKEKGLPFDPRQLPEYKSSGDADNLSTSGMGIFLMRQSMDEVSFHNLGMEGKETRLVKYLPSKSIEEYLTDDEKQSVLSKTDDQGILKEKIKYRVRRMEPHEAIQISRCAYKSHGYTFFDDHIYYPDRIIELNNTEQMISAVAITEENIFMGHSALVYPYPGARIAELTFIFVNKEYRGQGCMARICSHLFECEKKNPLDGIYVYSVTNHEFTQRGMYGFGIQDCGLLLASSPETWIFKGISNDNPQRISVALSFKYLTTPKPLALYPPIHHLEMIKYLYGNIGANCHHFEDMPAGTELPDGDTEIDTEIFATENCAEIFINHYGANTLQEVKKIVRDLCVKQIASIQLFISLEDPCTSFMVREFEDMGFFFAGILPLNSVGDTIVLQYLNNVEIDYDKIVLYTEAAKKIKDYIKSKDPDLV
jgi:anti-sigma regulatory factor (Ser/Thr protein kinase)